MFLTLITACENHTNFPSSIVQFDRLISDQLLYSLNIYQFDCSVLCFPFEFSSNNRTKSTSCFIFLFDLSKIMKLMKKKLKKATEGISWEIWCSNRETRRFDEKLGDSQEKRKSWQVCIQS